MALAPFFERIYGAVGGHLAISRESLTTSLATTTAGVYCGSKLSKNDIWISELVTNLISRLYPRISIIAPDLHASVLRDLAISINPNIEIVGDAPGFTTIGISGAAKDGAIFPFATGWVAGVCDSRPCEHGPDNPYAAGVAGALACTRLFNRVFAQGGPETNVSLSLLDFSSKAGADLRVEVATIGDVIFAGVGAVGNAAIWALARDEKIRGRFLLVDPEELTLLNLQRYVLGTISNVSQPKVELARRTFGSNVSIETYETSLEDFAEVAGGITTPTICISVDNIETRRVAQALLPRLVVNGWTGDRALGASWHLFSRDAACLACLYLPRKPGPSATEQAAQAFGLPVERATLLWISRQPLSEEDIGLVARSLGVDKSALNTWRGKSLGDLYTDVVCGAVPLDVAGIGRVEVVPLAHQSALAGILMATELLKRTIPALERLAQPEPLVSWDDVLRNPPSIWTKPRPREAGCICGDENYQEVYRLKWKS